MRAALLAIAIAAQPLGVAALEPRFDHRDTHGPAVELLFAHDTVAVSGRAARTSWRPALRVAYGFDPSGNGDEIILGMQGGALSLHDPDREHVLLAVDARYRAYFGTEELKTFFDVGAWAPLKSRLAIGPLVAAGIAYDFSRAAGVYASAAFATAFGEARVTTVSVGAGLALRFELP